MDPANLPHAVHPQGRRTFTVMVAAKNRLPEIYEVPQAGKVVMLLLAVLLLCAIPHSACAQVFIASHPQPDFAIGPLFVSASVGKENTRGVPAPLTVTVSWSLALPPQRRATDIAQDLYLLWPAEGREPPGPPGLIPPSSARWNRWASGSRSMAVCACLHAVERRWELPPAFASWARRRS